MSSTVRVNPSSCSINKILNRSCDITSAGCVSNYDKVGATLVDATWQEQPTPASRLNHINIRSLHICSVLICWSAAVSQTSRCAATGALHTVALQENRNQDAACASC